MRSLETGNCSLMDKNISHKITIIAPTCFYYQAPLFRALAGDDRIDLTVYFCTEEGSSGSDANLVYGTNESWVPNEELLQGYKFEFLRNHIPRGSYLKSLVGLANLGIWEELRQNRPDAVVIMSWMNPTWWLTFMACQKFGIPILLMTDANVHAEQLKSFWKSWLKRIFLGKLLFPAMAGFLCAGTSNRELYMSFGVPEMRLFPFVYSWGYSSLIDESNRLEGRKSELRKEFGLPQDSVVVLYCGRFSEEKGTVELINAYKLVSSPKKALVLVGDGRLKRRMEELLDEHDHTSVYFMGFRNRNEIGKFYALADILVLPSQKETWGMVVNEGLCFSLPVIVSDQVGAGADLVSHEENGYVFRTGDVKALAEWMTKLIELPDEDRVHMGEESQRLINEWSGRDLPAAFVEYIDSIALKTRTGNARSLLWLYRLLPNWIGKIMAFSSIMILWGAATGFLFLRPSIRRIKGILRKSRT